MRMIKLFTLKRRDNNAGVNQNTLQHRDQPEAGSIESMIWAEAPELSCVESPALLTDTHQLWLAYYQSIRAGESIAVVRFDGLIGHRVSPINDEGLGDHEYAKYGLGCYAFNELIGTPESTCWKTLGARHWVITFKDVTVDVIARSVELVTSRVDTNDLYEALDQAVRDK